MKEKELPIKCAEGDAVAQKILYERYSGHLYGVCLRYASDKEEAQDLLHDTFIKVFANIGRFSYRGEGSLKGWLTRVAVNLAIGRIRSGSRMQSIDLPEELAQEEPSETFIERIPPKVLIQFIEELPPGYRAVFNLYVFENMPHKEIAKMLGINEKSSSSQFFRAKTSMAKKINNYLNRTENGKQ